MHDDDGELKAHIQQEERKRERRNRRTDGRGRGRSRNGRSGRPPRAIVGSESEDDVGRSGLHKKCTRSLRAQRSPTLTYAQTDSSLGPLSPLLPPLLPSVLTATREDGGTEGRRERRTDRQTDTFPAVGAVYLPGVFSPHFVVVSVASSSAFLDSAKKSPRCSLARSLTRTLLVRRCSGGGTN